MRSVMRSMTVVGAISLAIGLVTGCAPKGKTGTGDPSEGAQTIQSIKGEKAAMGYGKGQGAPPAEAKADAKTDAKTDAKADEKTDAKAEEKK